MLLKGGLQFQEMELFQHFLKKYEIWRGHFMFFLL